ncbi:hypothetical protein LIER_07093 [Lithospermum erythrorhizon]|uniref:Uncharacterized protein n=1 Tax=Lithospermum erythrorhizon TaxID=34254 RepID=A0AAV3P8C0_LITER
MSQKPSRHSRRPSQGVFLLPDDLSAPLPESGGATTKMVAQPKENNCGIPLPPPPKSLEEMSTKDSGKEQEGPASNIK